MRAELEIGANRDELAGMTARLAPVDAFKQAGVDYASVLRELRFSVEKRANGASVVKVTSVKPVNEPFLDLLVELSWPAGRLVREYTFLLDPPDVTQKGAASQGTVAEAKVVDVPPAVDGAAASVTRPQRSTPIAKPPRETKAESVEGGRLVQPGDTLRKIATETKYEGVSLEQMLVGLFQANPDAFIGKNINRLKSGVILGVPDKSTVESVSEAEAKKVYVAQSSDWNAYRQKLASAAAKAPAKEDTGAQASSGKITAKVDDKKLPEEQAKDQVKVSKTEVAGKSVSAGKGLSEADAIAKDRALKEAQDRLAQLEKNVGELQKLVELKNQKLSELQQQAAVKKEEPKAVEPAKPVEPPKVVEPPKPQDQPKLEQSAKPVDEPKPEEQKAPVVAPEPPKPAPPVVEKKPAPIVVPEAEEPGFVDSLLEDPLPLAGGAGILALLAGYFVFKRRRNQSTSLETTAAPGPSSLGPNSVFRMTGGQSVDTGNTPPQTGDFSQTGPGTIDTDEVDPVAEADVYMAYGRDTQAEEILLEALLKDPQRTAIHAKLLEIYANRKSLKQFETLASELYAQTGGVGADWDKAAALGAALDPENPLYSAARTNVAASAFDADATMVASPEAIHKATMAIPDVLTQRLEEVGGAAPEVESPLSFGQAVDTHVLAEPAEPEAEVVEVPAEPEVDLASDVMSLDFDLGEPVIEEASPAVPVDEPVAEPAALDFDLGGVDELSQPAVEEPEIGELRVDDDFSMTGSDLSFDISPPASDLVGEVDLGTEVLSLDDKDAPPDFSPEGTLVVSIDPEVDAEDFEDEMESAVSTFVGGDAAEAGSNDLSQPEEVSPAVTASDIDFDLDLAEGNKPDADVEAEGDATATVVNPLAMRENDFEVDNPELIATTVNVGVMDEDSLEFDVKLTDSVFLGQPMMQPEFDIGSINLDLAAESDTKAEEVVPSVAPEALPEPIQSASSATVSTHDAQWEEVNTKLDLAKAYEEMGDLEGARELLQEVVAEGPADLVEQARSILDRIGE
ncbi:MAG: pilus assembly protein [Rhodocyclales bacterium GT-UBC]|nr:MAG: pilus assembly protein [Rhodocyclales bacterium GT-UBC]